MLYVAGRVGDSWWNDVCLNKDGGNEDEEGL